METTEATTINGIMAKLTIKERTLLWSHIDRNIQQAYNDGLSAAAYKIRNQITEEFSL